VADIVNERPTPLTRPDPVPIVSRKRFGAAYLLLAVIVGAAVGLIVVLATRNDTTHRQATDTWSTWRPATTGTEGVREIARHVSPMYRLANGHQLLGVVAGPMQIPSTTRPVPVSALLISSGTAGRTQERVDITFPNAGVFFQLCGRAAACQIEGTATVRRGQLLLREVLELALYTFHYLPEADNVVAFLPPAPGVQQSDPRYQRVIYLPREALTDQLRSPLDATIPQKPSIMPEQLTTRSANAIVGALAGRLYHYDFQQAPDNSVLLELSPIEP
jgi:hypothetical protein